MTKKTFRETVEGWATCVPEQYLMHPEMWRSLCHDEKERVTMQQRVNNLAKMMQLTPGQMGASLFRASDDQWWLVGCKEGDQPLPQTKGMKSEGEALSYMETWVCMPKCRRCGQMLNPDQYAPHADVECETCLENRR